MKCNYDREQFFHLLTNQPDEARRAELEAHLATCAECQMEWEAAKKIWMLMGEVPAAEPSEAVRAGFSAILRNYKEEEATNKSAWLVLARKIRDIWIVQPAMQMVYSIVLLLVGLSLGLLLSRPAAPPPATPATGGQLDSLSAQIREMKQSMAISLLENPSASERIRAVNYTNEISKANKQVIDALLETLNNDPNVNVRLVTLEALVKFANEPAVRQGLVQSIANQESPLLQSAIADVMVKLQEKRSVRSFRELLQKKDLNDAIRNKIELSIRKLT
jgi:hypothetical protein